MLASVCGGTTKGLNCGGRFAPVAATLETGLTGPLAFPTPPGNTLLPGLVPITAFAGSEVPRAGGSLFAAAADKEGLERGQNETMSHSTDPTTKHEPPARIARRSPARLLSRVVCMGATFVWFLFVLCEQHGNSSRVFDSINNQSVPRSNSSPSLTPITVLLIAYI